MAKTPTIDDFFNQSYKMNWDYEKLQELMGYIYENMKEEKQIPVNELLEHLSDISKSMLNTQREFVDVYADDSIKAQMHYKINSKEQALLLSESEIKGKSL